MTARELERRHTTRRTPSPDEALSRVRLRLGPELIVVNISEAGVLVDSPARLNPGARVDLHVVGRDGRVLVRSRVLRAWICALAADRIRYRAAVMFDQPVVTASG